jgi:hypothetical protein
MSETIYGLDGETTLRSVLYDLNIQKLLDIQDPESLTDEEKIEHFNYILKNVDLKRKSKTIFLSDIDVEIDEDDAFTVLSDSDMINSLERDGWIIEHKSNKEDETNFTYNENDLFEDFKKLLNKYKYWELKQKFKELL